MNVPDFEGREFHNMGAAIVNDLSPVVAAEYFSGGVNTLYTL